MQQNVFGRFMVVVVVVVAALYYIFPSARLIAFKVSSSPPDPSQTEQVEVYQKKTRKMESYTLPMGAHTIRLGLDLQGGTDITIELDREATIRDQLAGLRRDIERKLRRETIAATITDSPEDRSLTIDLSRPEDSRMANRLLQDYEDVFENWDESAFENTGRVTLRLTNEQINDYERDAIEAAWRVIRNRVDAMGLTQPVVVRSGNRIRVQMPGVSDPQQVVDNIIRPAQLEFRIVHENETEVLDRIFTEEAYQEVIAFIEKNKTLPEPLPLREGTEVPDGFVLRPGEYTDRGGDEFAEAEIRYRVYVLRDQVELTGEALRNAWARFNQMSATNPWEITLMFDRQGATDFRDVTERNVGRNLAIVLDDYVFSAPVIRTVIPNGQAVIEGDFTQNEAVNLSLVLKAGALPANLEPVDQYVVEATLGVDSIRKGLQALMIGAVAVVIFMIIYYGTAGFIAVIALIINILCILAILSLARATLTLSSIGGILLTIGMAVDANVLIYERIREEKGESRGLKAAIAKGFNRAFTVIFDSNLTTLITALVLLQFGTGSVQGFALTMTFGIFATLFTGLFVTHVLTDLWFQKRNSLQIGRMQIFRNPKIDFVKLRQVGYFISAALLVIGIGTMIVRGGPQFGVEFTGGVMAHATFAEETSEDEIKSVLSMFPTPIVQRIQGENNYVLRVKSEEMGPAEAGRVMDDALEKSYGDAFIALEDVRGVSDEVGGEFIQKAILAVLIASIGVLIFLWFRFELIFGAGAVVALFHDVLITMGLLSVFNEEITLNVVAALLIVVGYSVNDTIVIFDRIRETIRTQYGMAYTDMLNQSINRSLNRTTITSLSTLFVTLIMLLLGGPGLRGFALVLTIGIVIGTYSSSFVATPVLYEYHRYRRRQQDQVPARQARKKRA